MPKVPQPWLVQYLDGSGFIDPAQPLDPGFTQILQDTVGDVGGPGDGFDGIVSEVFGLIDALDAASAEQDAVLDAILAQHQDIDTTPFDNTIQNYVGTFDAGNSIVTDSAALSPPDLLELPLSSTFGVGPSAPPHEVNQDFGTVKLSSVPQLFELGVLNYYPKTTTGLMLVTLVGGPTPIFDIVEVDHLSRAGLGTATFFLRMTPAAVGAFVAQVNTISNSGQYGTQIFTFTVTVEP